MCNEGERRVGEEERGVVGGRWRMLLSNMCSSGFFPTADVTKPSEPMRGGGEGADTN